MILLVAKQIKLIRVNVGFDNSLRVLKLTIISVGKKCCLFDILPFIYVIG